MGKYDFSGWATRINLKCADGRTIVKDAFKHNSGSTVPLVWNHQHNDPLNVLGHALLENRSEGVYAYCKFNDTEAGQNAKKLVEHGDIVALSIYANQLQQQGGHVLHGNIREVSLVLAGANPGALIDSVICHSDESDEAAVIFTGEKLELAHSEEKEQNADEKGDTKMAEEKKTEKTVADVFNEMTEEQKTVVYALIGEALEQNEKEEGDANMKHNLFDEETGYERNVLSHADQSKILTMAKASSCGSLQEAIASYVGDSSLAHGIDEIETLFPEYKDVRPGAPEIIPTDQGWVGAVMAKTHKSPISRIRTRQADISAVGKAKGYTKGDKKTNIGNIKLAKRTTDPTTIYVKDAMHRDDIIDITDFDVVTYQYGVMKQVLNETIAMAIMVGDQRDDEDVDKIDPTKIRPIFTDEDLYVIHKDVDMEAAKAALQGTNTSANFGEEYIRAEAVVSASLYAREEYKGSGSLEFYCTPHELNVMLLARDLNGRRIYDSASDLAKALNVSAIHTAEQFQGITRTDKDGNVKKLLGIFVNLNDYQLGSTKGGEITKFNQFDIDFNQEKYLIETRLSGALTRVKSAIVLEEPVTE